MHVTSNRFGITVDSEDGTSAKVDIPPDELIMVGNENSYFICLSSVSNVLNFTPHFIHMILSI